MKSGWLMVDSISTFVVSRPYVRPFGISSGTSDVLTSLIVEVVAGDRTGIGEAAPMTAYTGETLDGVKCAVEDYLTPALVGQKLNGAGGAHVIMDKALRGQHLAKAAIDIALHDLIANVSGLPVHALLGGAGRDSVAIAWVIGLGDIDDIVKEAVAHADQGFGHIKVKGGEDPARDLSLVCALREALPETIEISLDANEGYSRSSAFSILKKMDRAGLSVIEQPLARWDLRGMAELRQQLRMQVMADESVQSIHDALAVIRSDAADIINIKILKVGGLHRARQIAGMAEAAGIAIKIGSMPELGVATLAALHLAASTPNASVAADLIGPLMVKDEPFAPDLVSDGRHGWLRTPMTPGLGHQLMHGIGKVLE